MKHLFGARGRERLNFFINNLANLKHLYLAKFLNLKVVHINMEENKELKTYVSYVDQ